MFEGLIDGLSQQGAHPLRLQQTANFVSVQDSVKSQGKCAAASILHLNKEIHLNPVMLTLSVINHLP